MTTWVFSERLYFSHQWAYRCEHEKKLVGAVGIGASAPKALAVSPKAFIDKSGSAYVAAGSIEGAGSDLGIARATENKEMCVCVSVVIDVLLYDLRKGNGGAKSSLSLIIIAL